MNYQTIDPVVGSYQANFVYAVDTTARMKTGVVVAAIDNYWGYGEFIYGKAIATVAMGSLCTITPTLLSGALETQMTPAVKTASTSTPMAVAMSSMTTGQFGWFCLSGMVPIASTAAMAAGTSMSLSATPGAVFTPLATFGINNAVVVLPATTTVVKAGGGGISGQKTITVPNSDGWFIGAVLTGTGVGASTLITNVSPDGRLVTVSVANSAAVSGNITATYTGFVVGFVSRPGGIGL